MKQSPMSEMRARPVCGEECRRNSDSANCSSDCRSSSFRQSHPRDSSQLFCCLTRIYSPVLSVSSGSTLASLRKVSGEFIDFLSLLNFSIAK